jgi:hypothetical protein
MALVGRAVVLVYPVMRAPPPPPAARCTPHARPGAAMPCRMGGWREVCSASPEQRWRRAVLVQVRVALV